MISIVVIYHNKQILDNILLKSLKSQTARFELILLNNVKKRFKSAAEGLNYGGWRARGKYIMFVHQDVELNSPKWLETAEKTLDGLSKLGIAGVAGKDDYGGDRGYISDCGVIWGKPFQKSQEAQTLDECLLIIPKSVFSQLRFDKLLFDNWHCYGADYCLATKRLGFKTYVIPNFIYHRSLRSNTGNLLKYQKRLYQKYKKEHKCIFTTAGKIYQPKLFLKSFSKFCRPLYEKVFPNWTEYLKRELINCQTVLDLGCGYNSPVRCCNVPFSVGVELFSPYLEESEKKGIHHQYLKADILKVEFEPASFDAVLCLEVLEHLKKERGYELIKKMQKWARKKIIITTPNGYLWQDYQDGNSLQEHKSGWRAGELKKLGFKVFGMNGWRELRGYRGLTKYRPAALWGKISGLTQKIVYYFPNFAFQLFAVKQIKKWFSKMNKNNFPKISIVIPNWNGQRFLADCLDSLSKINWPDYQVIVVDNGSTDNSVGFVGEKFPKVVLIENEKNLGFASACNQGIKWALERGADYVLLLNNDTIVAPDFLTKMAEVAKQEEKIGIVGAKIYYFDQPKKIWFAGGDFVKWRASGRHRFWQKQDFSKLTGVVSSDFVTGCAMLIKKQVFQDVGYFYESYFLTIEDLEFCWRAQKAGWEIKIDLDAYLWHKVSSSRLGEFSFSNGYYGTRNRLFFAFKQTHNLTGGCILLFLVVPIRIIQWILTGRLAMVKGMVLGCLDFFRGKMGQ